VLVLFVIQGAGANHHLKAVSQPANDASRASVNGLLLLFP